jgi:hypothetical protein
MSIFDVIRYPISDPPTYEELNNLPDDLFDMWCNMTTLGPRPYPSTAQTRAYMCNWYSIEGNNQMPQDKSDIDDLTLLRKLIEEL